MKTTMARTVAMKTATLRSALTTGRRRGVQAAGSAVTLASLGVVCTASTGPARQVAGLCLVAAFACAVWFVHRERFDALVPATGLTLAFLILAGLALAAVRALSTVPVALTVGIVTLTVAWVAPAIPAAPERSGRRAWFKAPNPFAAAGLLIFAVAAVLAVRSSAVSATADADAASSVALWAYPSGGRLHVGVQAPPGHGATTLRIVVTQAGATLAAWDDIRLAAGRTWEAPALPLTGTGPAHVAALDGSTVVASLSSR